MVAAFRQGLKETSYIEGQNVTIEYRWAYEQADRLRELAAELVRLRVNVIATPGSTPATIVAKAATASIPIVFQIGGDPVQLGLVASLNRPAGNVTGVTSMNVDLVPKQVGLVHELMPRVARFGLLVNPNNPLADSLITDARSAAMAIGLQIEILAAPPITISTQCLPASRRDKLVRFWPPPTRCCSAAACRSWRSPRTIRYQPSTPGVRAPRPAGS
jgi:putative ABC transport system substrate-binding protein